MAGPTDTPDRLTAAPAGPTAAPDRPTAARRAGQTYGRYILLQIIHLLYWPVPVPV